MPLHVYEGLTTGHFLPIPPWKLTNRKPFENLIRVTKSVKSLGPKTLGFQHIRALPSRKVYGSECGVRRRRSPDTTRTSRLLAPCSPSASTPLSTRRKAMSSRKDLEAGSVRLPLHRRAARPGLHGLREGSGELEVPMSRGRVRVCLRGPGRLRCDGPGKTWGVWAHRPGPPEDRLPNLHSHAALEPKL